MYSDGTIKEEKRGDLLNENGYIKKYFGNS